MTQANNMINSQPRKYEAIVMANRIHSSGNYVRFSIPELLPLTSGVMVDNPVPMRRKYRDGRGRIIVARGTHNNNFEAVYFSRDSYRKTPPDVQLGERIHVWQQGDTDLWYWEPTNLDSQSIRRSETVVQSVNADKPTGPDSGKHDDTNTYYTEVSSQNKTYTISTSKANGEVAAYKIQINAGGGAIVIQDDQNNFIQLDTTTRTITAHNACDTEVKLHDNHISVKCNNNYNEKIGGNKTMEVSGNVNITVKGNAKVDCPNTEITGNVKIGKNVEIGGTLTVKGGTSMGGGGSVTGNMSISGTLSANGPVNFPAGGSIRGYD